MQATILGLGTAVPPRRYDREAIASQLVTDRYGDHPLARKVLAGSGIVSRHSAIDWPRFYAVPRSTAERNALYWEHAPALAEMAARQALKEAALTPPAVDHLIVVSCTGVDIPGLDLILAERLGLSRDVQRTCVLGMGCYAAFPALRLAVDTARADPRRFSLVVCVEICSLHAQFDGDPEQMVCNLLFADGAAAAVIGRQGPGIGIAGRRTVTQAGTGDAMGFHLTDSGFRMTLAPTVPALLAGEIGPFLADLLRPHGLRQDEIAHWIVHPGGRKILDDLGAALELPPAALDASRHVLRHHGNMSSPTVLFVLAETLARQPAGGDWGVMLAFGPGLTIEGMVVRFGHR
jgi:predicted naringenin-chalcone synthase